MAEPVQARPYNGSITREQFLFRETRTVARLRLDDGLANRDLQARILGENLFERRTNHDIKSIIKACLTRLDSLDSPTLEHLLAHGPLEDAKQTNLYAMMRTYRLVWEFMVGVVGEKYRTFDLDLQPREIRGFLEELRAREPSVATWSDATLNKIRQVLTNCLTQVGVLEPRKSAMHHIYLSAVLRQGMLANGDSAALPAFDDVDGA